MATRKLDQEEQKYLSKMCQEIGAIGQNVIDDEIEAYAYDWNQLALHLDIVKRIFDVIKNNHEYMMEAKNGEAMSNEPKLIN
jgi:hypothetical protein